MQPEVLALVVWTGGQGAGELVLRIVENHTSQTVFRTRPRQVRFVGEPVAAVIAEDETSTFVAVSFEAYIDGAGSIVMERKAA